MTSSRPPGIAALTCALLLGVFLRDAEAYVDPGSGGMLVQLVLGALMAGLVMVRSGWHRVRAWLRREPTAGGGES